MAKPRTITARATVRLSGLSVGEEVQVDPNNTRIKGLLRSGLLVSEEPLEPVEVPKIREGRATRQRRTAVEHPADGTESPSIEGDGSGDVLPPVE